MPYLIEKKFIFNILLQPKLTQNLGPYIVYPNNQKYESRLSYEKDILSDLISNIPKYDYYLQNFNYKITNILPFYWNGFKNKVNYTYMLNRIKEHDFIFNEFRQNIRREIRKSEKTVNVEFENNIKKFYEVNKLTFERQGMKIPYTLDYLKKLDLSLEIRNQRQMFFAKDSKEQIHAAIYIIWDKNSAYYLMGGGDPKLRNSGATSLLMWEAIKFSSEYVDVFDFEGSMIEPVERFFRAFGAKQTPYFQITKSNSRLIDLKLYLDSWKQSK